MHSAIRKQKIKEYILENKNVSVIELSDTFDVSEETIRRDLTALENEGYIIRTHGGAVLAKRVSKIVDNDILKKLKLEEKQIIAKQCRYFIHEGDCIYLDPSTTAATLCEYIYDMDITVITNSVDIVNALKTSETIELICVGGNYSLARECFFGPTTNEILRKHFFDKAFISCRSLSRENGITDANDATAEIKKIIAKNSNRVFLIADNSKFDKTSFTKVCEYEDINDIVTDKPLSDEWKEFVKEHNINLWDTSKSPESIEEEDR